jgi:hypothetical protein
MALIDRVKVGGHEKDQLVGFVQVFAHVIDAANERVRTALKDPDRADPDRAVWAVHYMQCQ